MGDSTVSELMKEGENVYEEVDIDRELLPPKGKKFFALKELNSAFGLNNAFTDGNYSNASGTLYGFAIVTFIINVVYGFVAIFNTTSVPEIILNGTLVQIGLPDGTIGFVQLMTTGAILLDMLSIDPDYNGTVIKNYLPSNMAYTCKDRIGGHTDYFAPTYNTFIANEIEALSGTYGQGGVVTIDSPGPSSQFMSTSLSTTLMTTITLIAYSSAAFITFSRKDISPIKIEWSNRALNYMLSFFSQLGGLFAFVALSDNGRSDLYPILFGLALIMETICWRSASFTLDAISEIPHYVDSLNSQQDVDENKLRESKKRYVTSLKKNASNNTFFGCVIYAGISFCLFAVLVSRSQNWGFYDRMTSWGPQYSDMVSSTTKGFMWIYFAGVLLIFPIINYFTTSGQLCYLFIFLDAQFRDTRDVDLSNEENQGTRFYIYSTQFMTMFSYMLPYMNEEEGQGFTMSKVTMEYRNRSMFFWFTMYKIAIFFSMVLLINICTHLITSGLTCGD